MGTRGRETPSPLLPVSVSITIYYPTRMAQKMIHTMCCSILPTQPMDDSRWRHGHLCQASLGKHLCGDHLSPVTIGTPILGSIRVQEQSWWATSMWYLIPFGAKGLLGGMTTPVWERPSHAQVSMFSTPSICKPNECKARVFIGVKWWCFFSFVL